MDSNSTTVEVYGGVSVIYKDYLLSSDRAIYDRQSSDLELFGNIRVAHNGNYKILGKYAKINISKKERLFKPFYMLEQKSDVWISADKGVAKDKNIDISSGSISGCDPINPLWTMEFSSSDYNSKSKWLNLYNTRLYIYDIPVLYTPYFGYSLDTKRRTGLLMPAIGYSDNEGFFYEQPVYIAEQNWWDLELHPQLRTSRGKGVYQTFRFVDSKTSKGELKTGYFKEKTDYFKNNNLQNDSHYGFNFKYDNNNFINQWFGMKFKGQSGLYVDINHMNDVDYINLASNNNLNQATSTQVLSRVNMFYNMDNYYIGAYFKYYQDLTSSNNDNTLQKLPTFQYHYYLDLLLKDHLLYNLDIKSNNIERSINKKVVQTDINLPITLQTSLFDEYINISYKANIYMQHSKFSGKDENPVYGVDYRDGYFARNYHTLSASTQLTRAYEKISHVIGFGVTYNKAGVESRSGFYKDYSDANDSIKNQYEFYNISDITDEVQIDFTQYLYDSHASQIFYHRLAQRISYLNNQDRLGELENELDYKISSNLSFYNNMFYNYEKGLFSKIFNKVSFSNYGLNASLSHLYKDTFLPKSVNYSPYTSYMISGISYKYNQHYSYSASYNYDLEAKKKKSMEIGFMYKKRCWDFGIKYTENNRPVLTQSGESSIYDRFIYLTIVLKPLMKSRSGSSFLTFRLPEGK
jgi:LPS-assembly protein